MQTIMHQIAEVTRVMRAVYMKAVKEHVRRMEQAGGQTGGEQEEETEDAPQDLTFPVENTSTPARFWPSGGSISRGTQSSAVRPSRS